MKKPRGSQAQRRARLKLTQSLTTAVRIYGPTREMCVYSQESFAETDFHPNVAAKVVGLAFLSAVAAWEDFVEDVYLGYLCGYPAPNGYRPGLLCGPARNMSHALLLAAGESNATEAARRLRWNNFRWVRDLSTVHFVRDNVFGRVAEEDLAWLDLSQILRNRVAHDSEKAKLQYKRALNRLIDASPDAPLPRGFGVRAILS